MEIESTHSGPRRRSSSLPGSLSAVLPSQPSQLYASPNPYYNLESQVQVLEEQPEPVQSSRSKSDPQRNRSAYYQDGLLVSRPISFQSGTRRPIVNSLVSIVNETPSLGYVPRRPAPPKPLPFERKDASASIQRWDSGIEGTDFVTERRNSDFLHDGYTRSLPGPVLLREKTREGYSRENDWVWERERDREPDRERGLSRERSRNRYIEDGILNEKLDVLRREKRIQEERRKGSVREEEPERQEVIARPREQGIEREYLATRGREDEFGSDVDWDIRRETRRDRSRDMKRSREREEERITLREVEREIIKEDYPSNIISTQQRKLPSNDGESERDSSAPSHKALLKDFARPHARVPRLDPVIDQDSERISYIFRREDPLGLIRSGRRSRMASEGNDHARRPGNRVSMINLDKSVYQNVDDDLYDSRPVHARSHARSSYDTFSDDSHQILPSEAYTYPSRENGIHTISPSELSRDLRNDREPPRRRRPQVTFSYPQEGDERPRYRYRPEVIEAVRAEHSAVEGGYDSRPKSPVRSHIAATDLDSAPTSVTDHDWISYLRSKSILPANEEINWSGKGQHVEFVKPADVPLVVQKTLGHSANCLVDQCRFQRFIIARKTIQCSRRMTKEDALIEVEHLQRLKHPHIIQLIGSYVLGKKLAILLYPAADFNLEEFMEMSQGLEADSLEKTSLFSFTSCLLSALSYIHGERIKHMDIKPKNILVRSIMEPLEPYRVYLADFGIAKSYKPNEDMETNGAIAFTRTYCAPEVALQDTRGPKADIFSLGCVFSEMFTILANKTLDDFVKAREVDDDSAFHSKITPVTRWLAALQPTGPLISWPKWFSILKQMLDEDPSCRPSASGLLREFTSQKSCCSGEPASYEENYRQARFSERSRSTRSSRFYL
ncbi:MAG: hypothetical protein M1827_007117 [Pycnora praestabilis]|nr:MAG: hypothetical protein M1827_007117 [Pycnora praestabilis]